MRENKKTLLAGITTANELYFLKIEPKNKEQNYFSMSGFTIKPISEKDGETLAYESIKDGECWRIAVKDKQTKMGLYDWIDDILNIDGWQNFIDCSLYPDHFNYNGTDYYFKSESCGQHQERKLKHYLIDKKHFNELMKLWDENHLKKVNIKLPSWIYASVLLTPVKNMQKAFELLEADGKL